MRSWSPVRSPSAIGGAIGLSDAAVTAWQFGKWPVMLLLVLGILHLLFYAGPNARVTPKWISGGTVLALAVWIVASVGFAFYVANFGSYDKTYGTLGGVVIFLLWLWITNMAVLLGVEFNAETERARQLHTGVDGRARRAADAGAPARAGQAARPDRVIRWADPGPGGTDDAAPGRARRAARRGLRRGRDHRRRPCGGRRGGAAAAARGRVEPRRRGRRVRGRRAAHRLARGARAGGRFEVAAGEPWDPLVARWVARGLAGVECLSGIPGSVGATPIQNVGAYGQEVSETIVSVRAYDRTLETVLEIPARECGFSYRSSAFKRTPGRWVVLAVTFELERRPDSQPVRYAELARALGIAEGERAPLADVREAVLALRRRKGMVIDPADPDSVSAGSFFTNPVLGAAEFAELEERAREWLGDDVRVPGFGQPDGSVKTSAAWLIERSGFARGHGDPATVAISDKHTLALTNRGAGTTAQLVALAREIACGVHDRFGVALVPEPVFVGHEWAGAGA